MIETDAMQTPYEVDDLIGELLLDLVSESRVEEWKAARRRLRLAYQLAMTHPVLPGTPRATWGDGIPDLATCEVPVGGEGTPGVAVTAPTAWAAAAGCSLAAAKRLLSDVLDLRHRLPATWAAVEALEIPAWKGCRIAEDTTTLSAEAAAWVDTHLAIHGYGIRTIEFAVKQAVASFHPDRLTDNNGSALGKADWDVTLEHPVGAEEGGTSQLHAIGDSLDLAKFHDLIGDEATTLGRLGDTDTLAQRRAKALGRIADRHATLDLFGPQPKNPSTTSEDSPAGDNNSTGGVPAGDGADDAGAGETKNAGQDAAKTAGGVPKESFDAEGNLLHPETGKIVRARRSYLKARLYIHLTLTDLATMAGAKSGRPGEDTQAPGDTPGDARSRVVDTNLFGPQTLDQIQAWLTQLGSNARVTPVIDLDRDWAIDAHDPPEAMREQVILRDPHCVFPHCQRSSRHADLDHIDAYDPDGPPGQTSPERLAPLCRTHHLAKTDGRWKYCRNKDGTYTWTSQHGRTWLVTREQTIEIEPITSNTRF